MRGETVCESCGAEADDTLLLLFDIERIGGLDEGACWEEVLCASCANRMSRHGDVRVSLLDGGGLMVRKQS